MRHALPSLLVLSVAACGADPTPPLTTLPPPTLSSGYLIAEAVPDAGEADAAHVKLDLQLEGLQRITDTFGDASRYAASYSETAVVTVYGEGDQTGGSAIAAYQKKKIAAGTRKIALARIVENEKDNYAVVEWATNAQIGASVFWFDDEGIVTKEHRYACPRAPNAPEPSPELHVSRGSKAESNVLDSASDLYAAIDSKKAERLDAFLDDDSTLVDPCATEKEHAETKGTKNIAAHFKVGQVAFPDQKHSMPLLVAADDLGVVEVETRGTHTGKLLAMAPTSKAIKVHSLDVTRWKDGKVVRSVTYMNRDELLTQLGIPPRRAR